MEKDEKVICNNCGKEFGMIIKNLYIRPIDKDIRETYLKCPKCGCIYHVTYTNKKSRALTREWEREGHKWNSDIHKELKDEMRRINEYMTFMNVLEDRRR